MSSSQPENLDPKIADLESPRTDVSADKAGPSDNREPSTMAFDRPDLPSDPTAASSIENAETAPEDDVSIDQYMQQLLARVGANIDTLSAIDAPTARQDEHRETRDIRRSEETNAAEAEPPSVEANSEEKPVEMTPDGAMPMPRSVAAERFHDLSAMRELANDTARAAVESYSQRGMISRAYRSLTFALVLTCCGLAMLSGRFVAWPINYGSAMAALAIAVAFSVHFYVVSGRILKQTEVEEGGATRATNAGQTT